MLWCYFWINRAAYRVSSGTIQLDGRQLIRRHCPCRYAQTWGLWLNEEAVSSGTRMIGREAHLELALCRSVVSLDETNNTEPSKNLLVFILNPSYVPSADPSLPNISTLPPMNLKGQSSGLFRCRNRSDKRTFNFDHTTLKVISPENLNPGDCRMLRQARCSAVRAYNAYQQPQGMSSHFDWTKYLISNTLQNDSDLPIAQVGAKESIWPMSPRQLHQWLPKNHTSTT